MDRQKCEVWTRVMGYCRPLSQMNIGKKSEFCSRKYFDELCSLQSLSNQEFIKENMNHYMLITTTTCNKCSVIKKALSEKLGNNLVVIDENNEDFDSICKKYNLSQAPSLINLDNEEVVDIDKILA